MLHGIGTKYHEKCLEKDVQRLNFRSEILQKLNYKCAMEHLIFLTLGSLV